MKKIKKVRKAVGAIIRCPNEGNGYLLIQKELVSDTTDGKPHKMEPFWDLLKGGVMGSDSSDDYALERELKEELGITNFRIIRPIDERLYFDFEASLRKRIGFVGQITTIYLVEFSGYRSDVRIDRREIVNFDIVNYEEAIKLLEYPETKEFFEKYART